MRTFGRVWGGISDSRGYVIYNSSGQPILPSGLPPGKQYPAGTGKGKWVEVSTDSSGNNDLVYVTTLCQALLLALNESPVYSNVGLPARTAVRTGIAPDHNMSLMQQYFAPFFLSLVITKQAKPLAYLINLVTHQNVKLSATVPIPT